MCDTPIICTIDAIRRWLQLVDELTNRLQQEGMEGSLELSMLSPEFEDRLSGISNDIANSLKSGDRDSITRISLQFSRISQSLLELTLETSESSTNQLPSNIYDVLKEMLFSCQNINTQSGKE